MNLTDRLSHSLSLKGKRSTTKLSLAKGMEFTSRVIQPLSLSVCLAQARDAKLEAVMLAGQELSVSRSQPLACSVAHSLKFISLNVNHHFNNFGELSSFQSLR